MNGWTEIPEWLWVTATGLVVSILIWMRRQASGLGAVRLQTEIERDRVLELMRERLDLLEDRVAHLEAENEFLRTENARLQEEHLQCPPN